jgi:quercetin dioxygenase-like cupin family protein
MTRSAIISILCLALSACGSQQDAPPEKQASAKTAANAPPEAQQRGTVVPHDALSFHQIAPFVKMAAAYGDRANGAHGTFGEFPGGASSPPHTHSGAYHGVVISGTMTNPFPGEGDPPTLAAGSYWYVPAGQPHVTACVSDEPCRFYFHAAGKFDFAPLDSLSGERDTGAKTVQAAALSWDQVAPFVKMAAAHGDRAGGAHGTFGEFPGGASSPSHTHSGAYRAIVISGVMTNPFAGEADPPRMSPGSYWDVPAGAPHVTACVSDEPCRFYFHATSAFDFAPAE